MPLNFDLSALKDGKTTLPGLAMICLTILILSGKISPDMLKNLPWDYIFGIIFGGGGIALLGANSKKSDQPAPPPDPVPGNPLEPPAG